MRRALYLAITPAAEAAHNAEWCVAVEKRTGAPPQFRYFELQMLLDNESGSVSEWSSAGAMKRCSV